MASYEFKPTKMYINGRAIDGGIAEVEFGGDVFERDGLSYCSSNIAIPASNSCSFTIKDADFNPRALMNVGVDCATTTDSLNELKDKLRELQCEVAELREACKEKERNLRDELHTLKYKRECV